jgi:hypothetical protein
MSVPLLAGEPFFSHLIRFERNQREELLPFSGLAVDRGAGEEFGVSHVGFLSLVRLSMVPIIGASLRIASLFKTFFQKNPKM